MPPRSIKVLIVTTLCSLSLFLASCGGNAPQDTAQKDTPNTTGQPDFSLEGELDLMDTSGKIIQTIDIEIADTDYDRQRGLMYRPYLPENAGMLFIFSREEYQSFWMKNTVLSLDILFIGASGTINTIHKYTTPYSEASLPSKEPSTYVLELNAGQCDNWGIREGMKIDFRRISAEVATGKRE